MALEIIMPRLSDSMEEGTILQWFVAEGDHVETGQALVEIETDKANVTYEADEPGTILALSVGEGATVPVGAPIAVLGEPGEKLPSTPSPEILAAAAAPMIDDTPASSARDTPAGPTARGRHAASLARDTPAGPSSPAAPSTTVSSPSAAPSPSRRPKASPLARRLANALGVDLAGLAGSGPHGRVVRVDVERAAAGANGGAEARPSPAGREPVVSAKGEVAVHQRSRLQQTVARRMAESRATVPDFELRSEVDMSGVVELRERLRESTDTVLSYNDFIVKAVALALRDFPRVNAAYRDGHVESYSRINIGIAVAADDALVVPTVFEADRLSLGEISRTARELAARVRDGSISPADLAGGTFTVSNLGMYGVDSFTAVINPPQAAILAVGSVKPRPVVLEDGELAVRPTALLSLSCDHRVLYGADGARFLGRLREFLERRPDALLL